MALLNLEKDMEKYYSSKKVVEEAMRINWQYHTSGLNKDTFILSI